VPRLLYPVMLLVFLAAVGTFWLTFLLPRMQRIFHDFGMELPGLTTRLADTWAFLQSSAGGLVSLAVTAGLALALWRPGVRWYVPGPGRLYRMSVQSRVLKMLAVLVDAGKPLPEALAVLADSASFPRAVVGRLNVAGSAVGLGEPLPDSLWCHPLCAERGIGRREGRAHLDLERVFRINDLVLGDSALFCATGISDSALLPGIKFTGRRAETHSILMRARSRTVRHIHASHDLDHKIIPLRSRTRTC
jgi:hypothetical protein